MKPKVSVVIAARNEERTIEAALRSVQAQTLRALEVIVSDDGSTDRTAKIVLDQQGRDARIRLLAAPRPGGVSRGRNYALEVATGEWIAILDADDRFAPDRLERLVSEAERRQLDALADNLQTVDFQTQAPLGWAFPREWMQIDEPLDYGYLLDRDTPGNHQHRAFAFIKPLISRHFLQQHHLRYAEDVWIGEDFLFYLELLAAGGRMGVTDSAGYIYSIRTGSASNGRDGTEQLLKVNARAATLFRDRPGALEQFSRRAEALKYNRFVKLAKSRRWLAAAWAARHVSPSYLGRQLERARQRRSAGTGPS